MPAQLRFRCNVFCQNGNFPRVGAWTAPWIADIFFERLAFLDDRTGALHARYFRWSGRRHALFTTRVAPPRYDEFSIVAIGDSVRGEILPEIASGWLRGVWHFVFHRNSLQKFAFRIISMFTAAISDGNGLCDVV